MIFNIYKYWRWGKTKIKKVLKFQVWKFKISWVYDFLLLFFYFEVLKNLSIIIANN